jgi:hypothetical protein
MTIRGRSPSLIQLWRELSDSLSSVFSVIEWIPTIQSMFSCLVTQGAARPYLVAEGALAHYMAEDSLLPVRDGVDTTHLVC